MRFIYKLIQDYLYIFYSAELRTSVLFGFNLFSFFFVWSWKWKSYICHHCNKKLIGIYFIPYIKVYLRDESELAMTALVCNVIMINYGFGS